jgi:hypothetical protein
MSEMGNVQGIPKSKELRQITKSASMDCYGSAIKSFFSQSTFDYSGRVAYSGK